MMEFEQVLQLIDRVGAAGLTSFQYEADGIRLYMKTEKQQPLPVQVSGSAVVQCALPSAGIPAAGQTASAPADIQPSASEHPSSGREVKSPLVGIFYEAPAQKAAPFVQVGDRVEKGQVLAIVEAMKLMNEIESDFAGTVTEICVKDGDAVEYGQTLMRILED